MHGQVCPAGRFSALRIVLVVRWSDYWSVSGCGQVLSGGSSSEPTGAPGSTFSGHFAL
jgi:hypothetical protein